MAKSELIITGTVIHATGEGSQLGFPTANLDVHLTETALTPGVYAGLVMVAGTTHGCIIYFGPRLVHGEEQNNFEVHIFNFSDDLYGQTLEVTVKDFLRPPRPFTSIDELKIQLLGDINQAKKLLEQS